VVTHHQFIKNKTFSGFIVKNQAIEIVTAREAGEKYALALIKK
jgi:hypothetical protein